MALGIDQKKHYSTIDRTCYAANGIYILLHIFYLIVFIISKLYLLVGITAGVIVIFFLFYFLIKKKKYYLYALLCGNEFFAYIIATTLLVGFSTGFHFYLIGLCVVSFFTSYFSKTKDIKGSIVWVGLSLAIYLTLYLVSQFNEPRFQIEKWAELSLFITNAVVVFGFIAAYLVVFLKYALALENRIINESRTDELTGINNRYGLYDLFDGLPNKEGYILALFDVDNFKFINDTYGHQTGDIVLKRVAEITNQLFDDSFVCRYGGEEFVIVLENNRENKPLDRLEALRKEIEKTIIECVGATVRITITIGAVEYVNGYTLEKWVDAADKKMYSGKNSGKNKVVL